MAELEDASCLLDFAYGSIARSLLSFPMETLVEWRAELSAHVDALLSQGISAGRRGALLEVKGYLTLSPWPEPNEKRETSSYKIWRTEKACRAVGIWREMLRGLGDVPLFPLERFANRLSSFVVFLSQVDGFHDLVRETDELLRARFGNYKVAEKAMHRAINLRKAGRRLDAIDELHNARIGFFGREKIYGTVLASLQLAQWYEESGLFLAAKYFALGGAYAALNVDEEDIKHLVPRGLEVVTSSDYAAGASLLLFVSTYAYLYASRELGQPKPDTQRGQEEPDPVLFHLLLTTYAASLLEPSLSGFLIERFLKAWNVDDVYKELLPTMQKSYGATSSFAEFANVAAKANIGPPFCDAGGTRTVAWQQLGIHWNVNWSTDYSTNISGEAFVALLQILLGDLRCAEFSILPTEVRVTLRVHKGELRIQQLPDNTRVRLDVSLPEDSAAHSRSSVEGSPDVQAVAVTVLALVSALPPNEFLGAYEERLKAGLGRKFAVGASYESMFRQFYSPDIFGDLYEIGSSLRAHTDVPAVETDAGLSGPTGVHPQYSSDRAVEDIRNRYEGTLKLTRFTLRRLLGCVEFRRTVSSLRAKGWKDWHILTAIMNVRLNYLVNRRIPQRSSLDTFTRTFSELMSQDETETDPAVSEGLFSEEQLEMALHVAQLSYLRQLGFGCGQSTPNFGSVDKLLRRFRYWEDDIPHEDPFTFGGQPSERGPDEGPPHIESNAGPTEKGV